MNQNQQGSKTQNPQQAQADKGAGGFSKQQPNPAQNPQGQKQANQQQKPQDRVSQSPQRPTGEKQNTRR